MPSPRDTTQLLIALRGGERNAMDELWPHVHNELRAVARRRLRGRRPGQTLDTTALVNEAYLKLVDQTQAHWQDRTHFLSVAAVAMRHILVDHARRHAAQKRGGDEQRVTFHEDFIPGADAGFELLTVHESMEKLAAKDPRAAQVAELKLFGGLTVEEIAHVVSVSPRTVKSDWSFAKMWLSRALKADPDSTD